MSTLQLENEIKNLLQNVFDLDELRPHQLEIIEANLRRENVCVILPTGSEKTLTFLVPGLMYPDSQITLVISPLIALIEDQLKKLSKLQIPYLTTLDSKSHTKYSVTKFYDFQDVETLDKTKFIYTTPEKICNNSRFLDFIKQLHFRQRIRRVIVDECHVILHWGNVFRSDYVRFISVLLAITNNNVNYSLYSATLSESEARAVGSLFLSVLDDISVYPFYHRSSNIMLVSFNVSFRDKHLIGKCMRQIQYVFRANSAMRSFPLNDHFERSLIHCAHCLKQNIDFRKYEYMDIRNRNLIARAEVVAHFMRLIRPVYKVIIYCRQIKTVEALSAILMANGIGKILQYHAKLTDNQRRLNHRLFDRSGEGVILVATAAFGLGVDIPNVKLLINFEMPQGISELVQQIGRAGRDGGKCLVLNFYNFDDYKAIKYMNDTRISSRRNDDDSIGSIDINFTESVLNRAYDVLRLFDDDCSCAKVFLDYYFQHDTECESGDTYRFPEMCDVQCNVCCRKRSSSSLESKIFDVTEVAFPLYDSCVMALNSLHYLIKYLNVDRVPYKVFLLFLLGRINKHVLVNFRIYTDCPAYGCLISHNTNSALSVIRYLLGNGMCELYRNDKNATEACALPLRNNAANVNPYSNSNRIKELTITLSERVCFDADDYLILSRVQLDMLEGASVLISDEITYRLNLSGLEYLKKYGRLFVKLSIRRFITLVPQYTYGQLCDLLLNKRFINCMLKVTCTADLLKLYASERVRLDFLSSSPGLCNFVVRMCQRFKFATDANRDGLFVNAHHFEQCFLFVDLFELPFNLNNESMLIFNTWQQYESKLISHKVDNDDTPIFVKDCYFICNMYDLYPWHEISRTLVDYRLSIIDEITRDGTYNAMLHDSMRYKGYLYSKIQENLGHGVIRCNNLRYVFIRYPDIVYDVMRFFIMDYALFEVLEGRSIRQRGRNHMSSGENVSMVAECWSHTNSNELLLKYVLHANLLKSVTAASNGGNSSSVIVCEFVAATLISFQELDDESAYSEVKGFFAKSLPLLINKHSAEINKYGLSHDQKAVVLSTYGAS